MRYKNRLLSLLLMAALLLGMAQPVAAQDAAEAPTGSGIRFDAPPYAIDGPYGVGVRYFSIPAENEDDRDLTVSVWYPAGSTEAVENEIVYELQFEAGELPPFSTLGRALLDAPPDAADAPYPLVVYSHAHWSMGQELPYLVEHLASRGFVVISTDHEDNWSTDLGPMAFETMIRRPQEVTRQIDFAEALSAPGGDLDGMIDTKKTGIAGFSIGGVTAMAAAGAQMDLAGLREWCSENPALVEENSWACIDILDHEAEMAAFAGLDEVPSELWPSAKDERIAAAVRLSGSLFMFGSDGMAPIDVPVLLMHGGGEEISDPGLEVGNPYESAGSQRKAELVLDLASHMVFWSSCADSPSMVDIGFPMFCTDPVWDTDRAHDLINHFTTAFFEAELKDDADAAAALAAENVAFPGIEFQSVGYSPVTSGTALDDATVAKIEGIIEKAMTDFPVPGFEMCIVKDGDVVYSKGFGLADVADNRPVSPQTIQIQASISKSLTAAAIMRLAEQGMIDLDAAVTDYLPYFTMADERYQTITVRMLLSHRSGIPDTPPAWPDPLDPTMNPLEQAVRDLSDVELLFAPDEGWAYSGYGYSMLGAIIAEVTGEPYESYMAEQWLGPLGMAKSTFITKDVDPATRMTGYVGGDAASITPAPPVAVCDERDASACTLWSNCEEMAKYAQFLLNRGTVNGTTLLQPDSIEAMWTPLSETGWEEMNGPWYGPVVKEYGLGWVLGEVAGHRLSGHPGGFDGYNSQILLAPDDGLAVLTMDNWLDLAAVPAFPASFAATDVMYALLGIEDEMAGGAPKPQVRLDADTVAAIDTMIEETLARTDVPGLAIAVVKDGEVAYAKGYGTTSLDGGAPVTDQTVFQWCETSMALTTMAVMKLADEGKLDLDKPIVDYVPYFHLADERYKEITTGQILAQVAGIPDSGAAMADWETFMPQYDGAALERWVRNDLAEKGLLFAPGEGWEYSDLAYALLGSVIEAASGQPYEAYMTEHFFAPLGMEKSTFLLEEVDKTLLASPHIPDAEGATVVTKAQPYHRPFAAANNLFANVADMAKLAQFSLNRGELNGARLLPESAFDTMWTATTPTPFADFPFGRIHPSMLMLEWGNGWFLGDIAGHPAPNTGGGEHGYLAQMFLVPDANLGVVAVGNRLATDEYYAADIAADVLGMLLEK